MQRARADFYAKLLFRAKNLRSVTPLGRNTVNGDEFSPLHIDCGAPDKTIESRQHTTKQRAPHRIDEGL